MIDALKWTIKDLGKHDHHPCGCARCKARWRKAKRVARQRMKREAREWCRP